MKKIKSREASVENVKRFFSNTPNNDVVSINDAFLAWGRDLNNEDNKAWLSNLLFHLKYHNLITPIYSLISGRRKLDQLRLTLEGKRALGRIEGSTNNEVQTRTNGNISSLSIIDLTKLMAQFQKENKDNYEITFDIKLKSG